MGTLRTQRRSAIGASTPLERGYPHGGEAGYHAAGVPSTSEGSERVMGQSHDVGAGKLSDALGVAAAQHCQHEWVSTSSTAGDSSAIRLSDARSVDLSSARARSSGGLLDEIGESRLRLRRAVHQHLDSLRRRILDRDLPQQRLADPRLAAQHERTATPFRRGIPAGDPAPTRERRPHVATWLDRSSQIPGDRGTRRPVTGGCPGRSGPPAQPASGRASTVPTMMAGCREPTPPTPRPACPPRISETATPWPARPPVRPAAPPAQCATVPRACGKRW
jgi:hypothetical protein